MVERRPDGAEPAEASPRLALPSDVLDALSRPPGELLVVVATTDPNGAPRTAAFGTMRAVAADRLRFGCRPSHDTFANIQRDGRVMVGLYTEPDVAVSIAGRARVLSEALESWPTNALIEVDVTGLKDDRVAGLPVTRGIGYAPDGATAKRIAAVNEELLTWRPTSPDR